MRAGTDGHWLAGRMHAYGGVRSGGGLCTEYRLTAAVQQRCGVVVVLVVRLLALLELTACMRVCECVCLLAGSLARPSLLLCTTPG